MKTFAQPDKRVDTPWLDRTEAAAYCGLSLSTFDAWAKGWIDAGSPRHRRWHTDTLDKWIRGELTDRPFGPPPVKTCKPRRRPAGPGHGNVITLTDPVNGNTLAYQRKETP